MPGGTFTILAAAGSSFLLRFGVPLVQGFAAARAQEPCLRLVLATAGATASTAATLRDQLLAAADWQDVEGAITLLPLSIAEALPQWQNHADLFLWNGQPLGLPLPLIDAVLAGLPSVAPASAASMVGLSPGCFVPLATQSLPVDAADEPVARVMPLWHDAPTVEGVRDALLMSVGLNGERRTAIARAARREIEHRFGLDAFRSGLRRVVDRMSSGPHDDC